MGGRILIITDYKMGPSFNLLYYSVIGTLLSQLFLGQRISLTMGH